MATAVALPPARVHGILTKPSQPATQLPQSLVDSALREREPWDAQKHVKFKPPGKIYTMKELGLEDAGISPTAVSEPFSMFSEEAIKQMRAEIFSKPVLDSYQCSSHLATHMIRGFCPQLSPFIHDAWHSPEVLAIIAKIAGIELLPALDYDVGHINISINDSTAELVQNPTDNEEMSAFGWHTDSYPFVVVTMLSDCTGMIGGETALRTGTGEIMKVRGPAMGTAVVMQGRYIEHQAMKALGGRERISMVTSFRPKSPLVRDDTILNGVRLISDLSELYAQYAEYRLGILEERVRDQLKKIRDRRRWRRQFDTTGAAAFLTEQKQFVDAMLIELLRKDA